ncbi:MAG: hypothetical protein M8357_07330 [Desulfobulbaceae bacterium]|nr:hypothetical protein [Desulfobulbaceae bacterium]
MAKTLQENRSRLGGLRLDVATTDKMGRDASEVGIGVIMVLAALIGIWGIACLFGGIIQSGGVSELINGYLAAVTGR